MPFHLFPSILTTILCVCDMLCEILDILREY